MLVDGELNDVAPEANVPGDITGLVEPAEPFTKKSTSFAYVRFVPVTVTGVPATQVKGVGAAVEVTTGGVAPNCQSEIAKLWPHVLGVEVAFCTG